VEGKKALLSMLAEQYILVDFMMYLEAFSKKA
jgi:hypothetical protein